MQAIQTVYNGYKFRSRSEARFAVFLDALNIRWEYEKEGYVLKDGTRYLPDFYLQDFNIWIEIKGDQPTSDEYEKLQEIGITTNCDCFLVSRVNDADNSIWHLVNGDMNKYSIKRPVEIDTVEFARKMFSGELEGRDWGIKMNCPICGFDYTHIQQPSYKSTDDYEGWSGRGDAIRIPMFCEGGCSWDMRLGFHKGNTYFQIENPSQHMERLDLFLAGNDEQKLIQAYLKLRSARFEFGESGSTF